MEYAPEVFYDKYNGGDTSWIKGQMAGVIAQNYLVPDFKNVEKDYTLQLIEGSVESGKPSYNIVKNDEFGGILGGSVLLDNRNQRIVFTPNIEETDFYKEAQKQYNKDRQYTKQELLAIMEDKVTKEQQKKEREKQQKYYNWK
jgi:hypothetical protein